MDAKWTVAMNIARKTKRKGKKESWKSAKPFEAQIQMQVITWWEDTARSNPSGAELWRQIKEAPATSNEANSEKVSRDVSSISVLFRSAIC